MPIAYSSILLSFAEHALHVISFWHCVSIRNVLKIFGDKSGWVSVMRHVVVNRWRIHRSNWGRLESASDDAVSVSASDEWLTDWQTGLFYDDVWMSFIDNVEMVCFALSYLDSIRHYYRLKSRRLTMFVSSVWRARLTVLGRMSLAALVLP